MLERWKSIENWPYEVSDHGRVKSYNSYHKKNKNGSLLKPWYNAAGYQIVSLCKEHIRKNKAVARLVSKAFVHNPNHGIKIQVNHKNGIADDNHYLNLEWVTPSENILHARRNGLIPYKGGEKCPFSKLKNDQVLEIRYLSKNNFSQKEIAKKFGIKPQTVSKIIRRERWKHI